MKGEERAGPCRRAGGAQGRPGQNRTVLLACPETDSWPGPGRIPGLARDVSPRRIGPRCPIPGTLSLLCNTVRGHLSSPVPGAGLAAVCVLKNPLRTL